MIGYVACFARCKKKRKMVTKIVKFEDMLEPNQCLEEPNKNIDSSNTSKSGKSKKTVSNTPRGKPKSGRIWKSTKTRFSSVVKTKGIKSSLEKKQALREELKRVKEASRAILAAKQEEKEQKKQRRRESLKRQEENKKKSEIVQVIKNPNKIKRMKKKQLRFIEKRDTNEINT